MSTTRSVPAGMPDTSTLHDISFTEGAKYIVENAEEVYHEEQATKSSVNLLSEPPWFLLALARNRILLIYITPPYYRGYFLALPWDERKWLSYDSEKNQKKS